MASQSSKHIGLIGCGRWGKNILRDLKTLGCHVTVVAKSNESKNNARTHHADHIVATIDELSRKSLDGFIVATPTDTHADVIERLIPQKRPIFTEKPFTNDVRTASKLLAEAGDYIFVMDKWKYHNGIIKLAALINTGDYGDIKQLVLKRNQWRSPHKDVDPVWILIPHDICIVQFILDETPKAVFATGNVIKKDYLNSLYAVLEAKGINIVIETSADAVLTERSVSVICEKASLVLSHSYAEHILILRDSEQAFGAEPQKIAFEPNMPLFDEIAQFVSYLSDPTINLHSTATEGFETVQLITELRKMVLD